MQGDSGPKEPNKTDMDKSLNERHLFFAPQRPGETPVVGKNVTVNFSEVLSFVALHRFFIPSRIYLKINSIFGLLSSS